MKKLIIGVLILIAAVLIFIVIKGKQSAYGKAEAKVDTPEKLEKFNKFMAYTWENGDVNHDNYLSPEEFAAQRQRNREKFSRKK